MQNLVSLLLFCWVVFGTSTNGTVPSVPKPTLSRYFIPPGDIPGPLFSGAKIYGAFSIKIGRDKSMRIHEPESGYEITVSPYFISCNAPFIRIEVDFASGKILMNSLRGSAAANVSAFFLETFPAYADYDMPAVLKANLSTVVCLAHSKSDRIRRDLRHNARFIIEGTSAECPPGSFLMCFPTGYLPHNQVKTKPANNQIVKSVISNRPRLPRPQKASNITQSRSLSLQILDITSDFSEPEIPDTWEGDAEIDEILRLAGAIPIEPVDPIEEYDLRQWFKQSRLVPRFFSGTVPEPGSPAPQFVLLTGDPSKLQFNKFGIIFRDGNISMTIRLNFDGFTVISGSNEDVNFELEMFGFTLAKGLSMYEHRFFRHEGNMKIESVTTSADVMTSVEVKDVTSAAWCYNHKVSTLELRRRTGGKEALDANSTVHLKAHEFILCALLKP